MGLFCGDNLRTLPYFYCQFQMGLFDVGRAESLALDVTGDFLQPLFAFVATQRQQLIGQEYGWVAVRRRKLGYVMDLVHIIGALTIGLCSRSA